VNVYFNYFKKVSIVKKVSTTWYYYDKIVKNKLMPKYILHKSFSVEQI